MQTMFERKRLDAAFSVPLLRVAVIGSLFCGAFYTVIQMKSLAHPILTRYAMCHWVAAASVWLFCIACCSLAYKCWSAFYQRRLTREAGSVLHHIVEARHELDGGTLTNPVAMGQWLDTLWRSQKSGILLSWFGQRVTEFITRQIKRRTTKQMDEDLRELAERDGDTQHSSHGMIRIICWAMPMLGFLGTVLGISDTLGHMDAQALASGSQEAMNKLTGGLYVAFDTTAVGLILTMIAMFIQFGVQRMEGSLLNQMDNTMANAMHECLSMPEAKSDTTEIQASLRAMTNGLMDSVQQLVQKQSELWRDTISEAHRQWLHLSDGVTETAKAGLLSAIRESLNEYREAMQVQAEELVRLQSDGAQQIDARLQQWQTTISEQARASLRQQQEMNKNAELLQQLLDSSQLVGAMQTPIEATLNRLTDIDRFHDAAVCLTEAVAVLGTQMERYGYLGRQPVRRREPDKTGVESDAVPLAVVQPEDADPPKLSDPQVSKPPLWKRRAG
jgi:biopolymer transport protein ExbB/TolQ